MPCDITIRPVSLKDVPNLLALYAPYVTDTAVTFEYDVPSAGAFGKRITDILQSGYPYLAAQHILNLYACIAYPNPESIAFHESFGYQKIGHFHQCGFKLGRWYDMVWMEKMLGTHTVPPASRGACAVYLSSCKKPLIT